MSLRIDDGAPIAVIGAGIMGAGIAQVAAQAGHPVMLLDAREGAAAAAREGLARTFDALVAKGRIAAAAAQAALGRIIVVGSVTELAGCRVVVEAIVESLEVKRGLFAELESVVAAGTVLATNTSSLSVTAIARGLAHPQRVVGMHFFNPVPLMRLVEVVSGLQTDRAVAESIHDLATRWGKTAVHARSTPGFIVNRIARPYYAEALALLQEQAVSPEDLDACLRGAGFRMGPCELMDLIGHDTNLAVTRSVFEANFADKRYQPSIVQQEMVDGGLLGRKSGRGFYAHPQGTPAVAGPAGEPPARDGIAVHGRGPVAKWLGERLDAAGVAWHPAPESAWTGLGEGPLCIRLTDGHCISERVARGEAPRASVVFDLPVQVQLGRAWTPGTALAVAVASQAPDGTLARACDWLRALDIDARPVADVPGLLVARTISMLVNEAADAVHQGVCDEGGADDAMRLGVNYPAGPFEWLRAWGAAPVAAQVAALDAWARGERYRLSPRLQQALWASR
jgi:3-hydroxybutyryl-CoA dehydrogenase